VNNDIQKDLLGPSLGLLARGLHEESKEMRLDLIVCTVE
jgi:hypothetical protein